MKKGDLKEALYGRRSTGIGKVHFDQAVDDLFEIIQSELANGEKVVITGFGTFEVRERAASKGRNPRTGATVDIPATNIVKFKPGKALKEAVK